MTRTFRHAAVIFTWLAMALNSCVQESSPSNVILQIEGVVLACNITTSYGYYGSLPQSEESLDLYLPASDGDLLYMVDEEDLELYYRYSAGDGTGLVVELDTLKPHLGRVNGRVASLLIRDTLTGELIRELERSGSITGRTGLYLDADMNADLLKELVALCNPEWMALSYLPSGIEVPAEIIPEEAELLWIDGELLEGWSPAGFPANLESLILTEWDPPLGERLLLSDLDKLENLTLADCGITTLASIEFPPNLKRLHLVGCDTLSDVTAISKMKKLESLGLAGSEVLGIEETIGNLSNLTRVSFPGGISQETFSSITGNLEKLEAVEILDCPGITDMSPLEGLERLRILVLSCDTLPNHLETLSRLELMVLDQTHFEESPLDIAALQASLPDTRIVPGSGLCMGSGWLLLLLPLVVLTRFILRKRS